MKLLRQLQVSGRRRVDFHIRRNEQTSDIGVHVSAALGSKVNKVPNDTPVRANSEQERNVSHRKFQEAGKAPAVSGAGPEGDASPGATIG